jgi:hypothetical protein
VCTVSIVPAENGLRLICNRDERRSRPLALPPQWRSIEERRVVYPTDSASGGTWIGANDAGLVLALLNRSAISDPPAFPISAWSRGVIVPSLLSYGRLVQALDAALDLPLIRFKPFRLAAIHGREVALLTSDGRQLTRTRLNVSTPLLWTSSSLGDVLVEGPRSALFERLVRQRAPTEWRQAQQRFHRHRWRKHPELSVVMNRPDACTVSRTIVDVANGWITMRYYPLVQAGTVIQRPLRGAA